MTKEIKNRPTDFKLLVSSRAAAGPVTPGIRVRPTLKARTNFGSRNFPPSIKMEELRQELKAKRAVGLSLMELKVWLEASDLDVGFELKGSGTSLISKILDAMKAGKVTFRGKRKCNVEKSDHEAVSLEPFHYLKRMILDHLFEPNENQKSALYPYHRRYT